VPAEFRLPEPEFTDEQLDLLEELIQLMSPGLSRAEDAAEDERVRMASFLAELGTGIWRVKRKIEVLSRMPKEIKDALYSLESMWMSMSDGGVEIIDHIGTIPSKQEARVIEVREIPGLAREQVVDTVKPTILIHGEVVQQGEVVMGKPHSQQSFAEIMKPAPPTEKEELPPDIKEETTLSDAPYQSEELNESDAPIDAEPEADGDFLSNAALESEEHNPTGNPSGEEMAAIEDATEQPAPDENKNDDEPKTEAVSDDEPKIEIPLPQKRTRRKKVLPASIGTKLAEIPEIGEKSENGERKVETVPKARRKRGSGAAKNRLTQTDETFELDGGVRKEEA
jgi:hypothetical protein